MLATPPPTPPPTRSASTAVLLVDDDDVWRGTYVGMLPKEVWRLVLEHRAALVLQRSWVRYTLYSHARDPRWNDTRAHLRTLDAWPELLRFAHVRREWRHELPSWSTACFEVMVLIRAEAHSGLWGAASTRLRLPP